MVKHSKDLSAFADELFCLSVFDHFVGLALKGLKNGQTYFFEVCLIIFLHYERRSEHAYLNEIESFFTIAIMGI